MHVTAVSRSPQRAATRSHLALLLLTLLLASCLGDDASVEDEGTDVESAEAAVSVCRSIGLQAERDPALATGVDDVDLPVPSLLTSVPATLQSQNPHPNALVVLTFRWSPTDNAQVGCGYQCPASDGACSSSTLELVGDCTFGSSYPGPYPAQPAGGAVAFTHVELAIRTASTGTVPPAHGPMTAAVSLIETGTCPSGCPDLDDGEACTADRCVLENGVPTAVHTDMCDAELPLGAATSVGDVLEALLAGTDPIQRNADPQQIDLTRAAGITGKITRHDGYPAAGARVRIHGRPEYGETETDGSGEYIMLAEGGGRLVVDVSSAGYLPVHREVRPDPLGWARAADVVLTPLSVSSTTVAADADEMVAAAGDVVSDDSGTRRGLLLVPAYTTATLEGISETSEPAPATMTVRITEYTEGEGGPARMPAALPPSSAYTYAVEISLDEAIDAEATGVAFNQPVIYYVDNFLGFPVGTRVPVGRYDRERAAWIASRDGHVVRTTAGNPVGVDADGNGTDDSVALGISIDERDQLTTRYGAGKQLWRTEIEHLSPCDLNWPFIAADTCAPDECDDDLDAPREESAALDDTCTEVGSIIECDNQILGESIPVVGTGMTLNYRSDRVPGNAAARTITASLTEGTVASMLKSATITVDVAGQRLTASAVCPSLGACATDETASLTWNGRDRYGRLLQGRQSALVTWTYDYELPYAVPAINGGGGGSFGGPGGGAMAPTVRGPLPTPRTYSLALGAWDARVFGLGGWSLDAVHAYDPASRVVYYGDGRRRSVQDAPPQIRSLKKFASGGHTKVAAAPDGTIYATDSDVPPLYRIDPDGTWTVVGNLPEMRPTDLDVDDDGRLHVSMYSTVQRRELDGTWTTIAGTGNAADALVCDGRPATLSGVAGVLSLAVAPDGTVYLGAGGRICRVGTDARMYHVAGTGAPGNAGDGLSATAAAVTIGGIRGIDVAADGAIVFTSPLVWEDRIRRILPNGIIETIAGGGLIDGPSVPALQARLSDLEDLAIDARGVVYFVDTRGEAWGEAGDQQVVSSLENGIITTVAGKRSPIGCPPGNDQNDAQRNYCGDRGPAAEARLRLIDGLTIHPRGVVIGDYTDIVIIEPSLPGVGFSEILVPSEDGTVVDVFDARGRHLRTRDALTGDDLLTIGRDGRGRIASITDRDGLQVVFQGLGGTPINIIGPYGHTTRLSLDQGGYVEEVENPAGETHVMEYDLYGKGLLQSFKTPRNVLASTFAYDSLGRLIADSSPSGEAVTLEREELDEGRAITFTTALLRETVHEVTGDPETGQTRIVTGPDGLATTAFRSPSSAVDLTLPDGTTLHTEIGRDPLWGGLAPFVSLDELSLPSGKTRTLVRRRTASPASLSDPFLPAVLTEKVWINPTGVDAQGVPTGSLAYTRTFDRATRTETWTTPLGRTISRVLDASSRTASVDVPGAAPVTQLYDDDGRPTFTRRAIDGLVREWSRAYHATEGSPLTVVDPLAQTTTFGWDDALRPQTVTRPGGSQIALVFDDNGNLTGVTPPGRPTHAFGHTPVDLVSSYTPPFVSGAGATTYAYDGDRALDLITRPGGVTLDLIHDGPTGRLTEIRRSSSEKITVGYDSEGRADLLRGPQWSLSTSRATLDMTYDGPFVTAEATSGAVVGTVGWTADDHLRVGEETINSGSMVAFEYDDDGLLESAGPLSLVRHPGTGAVTESLVEVGAASVREVRDYHPDTGLLRSIAVEHNDLTPLFSATYERDALGRIEERTESVLGAPAVTTTYEYDTLGRLTDVFESAVLVEHYEYDATVIGNGNRTLGMNTGGTKAGSYDAQDRLTSYGAAGYAWRADGNLGGRTGPAPLTVVFDAFGNLTMAASDTAKRYYIADARGRRIRRAIGRTVTHEWLWSTDLAPAAQLNASHAVTQRYVYGEQPNAPEVVLVGADRWRLVKDHLGSVRLVVDVATGAVLRRLDFDSFGRVLPTSAGTMDIVPFGFAGGLWDVDTGLVRFGARDYEPETGRWIAKDPAQFGGGLNFYVYAGNDPVNYVDLTGHAPEAARDFGYGFGGVGREDAETRDALSEGANLAVEWGLSFVFAEVGGAVASRLAGILCKAAARGGARFASESLLMKHVGKHAGEWPGGLTQAQYLSGARKLLSARPGGGVLGHVRANGDVLRYRVATNEFAARAADGTIKTFFRPDDGMAYWLKQVGR